jgi:hypothetical protein
MLDGRLISYTHVSTELPSYKPYEPSATAQLKNVSVLDVVCAFLNEITS